MNSFNAFTPSDLDAILASIFAQPIDPFPNHSFGQRRDYFVAKLILGLSSANLLAFPVNLKPLNEWTFELTQQGSSVELVYGEGRQPNISMVPPGETGWAGNIPEQNWARHVSSTCISMIDLVDSVKQVDRWLFIQDQWWLPTLPEAACVQIVQGLSTNAVLARSFDRILIGSSKLFDLTETRCAVHAW